MDEAVQLQLSEARTAYLEAAANDDIEDKELRSLGAAVVEFEKQLQTSIKEQQSKAKEAKERGRMFQ